MTTKRRVANFQPSVILTRDQFRSQTIIFTAAGVYCNGTVQLSHAMWCEQRVAYIRCSGLTSAHFCWRGCNRSGGITASSRKCLCICSSSIRSSPLALIIPPSRKTQANKMVNVSTPHLQLNSRHQEILGERPFLIFVFTFNSKLCEFFIPNVTILKYLHFFYPE